MMATTRSAGARYNQPAVKAMFQFQMMGAFVKFEHAIIANQSMPVSIAPLAKARRWANPD
jgi:hypothetical protein